MFISVCDLFKIGIGPSSSHTMGPMVAASEFKGVLHDFIQQNRLGKSAHQFCVQATLRGSLAFTGSGHATDKAVILGLHGYLPHQLAQEDVDGLFATLKSKKALSWSDSELRVRFDPTSDVIFDYGEPLPEHPNGLQLSLLDTQGKVLLSKTYFSIGGGFIKTAEEFARGDTVVVTGTLPICEYPFSSAKEMLAMCEQSGLSIAQLKRANELSVYTEEELEHQLQNIWLAMKLCCENGLKTEGVLPGSLKVQRRAKRIYQVLQQNPERADSNDWLCAYAMAVNEENAAGHLVVTAPTNGAAGVIPAVLYYLVKHKRITGPEIHDYLLTAAAIGGIIKHRASISGAEVGCQGEVGSASAMAAAGVCAVLGGTPSQVENAAEIALEHHLGMTCDPVAGLVQVPCIERNGFGAIKAYAAASLALHGTGQHVMPLDSCIAAMKQTGLEMSVKFKETSLGGLAVSLVEC
ncbi:L-serine ammonia-lyase [Marinibactrum halimedae]|uniref:L-serine dehydratase n=1 Tax=Marinibactrum halimedae TaxID=1444977 RepID=A0AA37WP25_9GAMM|nr:L-serine ammonia-lyase [Marinibactrum halimedae]MCD9457606.1 L-serine ammonia-lyase [Marinibactrum halimedae]GLS28025.1 L-serine dehydratase [Marinibactrum halimedae]